MILIQNAHIYSPEPLGKQDVLIAGTQIIAIADHIPVPQGVDCTIVDATDLRLIPGLIDAHVHIAGAGGEGGPASRTPEIQLSMILEAATTTVVGCLGTDGFTRPLTGVLMKCKALRAEGISAWMYSGSYQVPTPTFFGDIAKDLALIEEVIGVGEVAISDHRSSVPSTAELVRLAEHARVGGMLGGKAGIVHLHMGDAQNPFKPIHEAVAASELTYRQFYPTHCNRNDYIFEDAKEYAKRGYIDITTSSYPYYTDYEIKPSKALRQLLDAGVPAEHITFTSDACGSLPHYDSVTGELVRLEVGRPLANLHELRDAVNDEKIPLETALKVLTSNVADILKLKQKGRIAVGKDADIALLDHNFEVIHLFAMGKTMIHDRKMLKRGKYEK